MSSRLLGIDFGAARIGLALSDETGLLARPLETVPAGPPHADPLERIAAAVAENGVGAIVVGVPYLLDGRAGAAAERTLEFAERLRSRCPGIPVHLVDERLTTVEARRRLERAGKRESEIRSQIDQTAAAFILQDFLDESAGGSPLLPPESDES